MKAAFEELKAYFKDLAIRHKEVNGSFVHGDVRRFTAASRSELTYPCLWLETPFQTLNENVLTNSGAFVILWNSDSKDPEIEDQIWEKTNRIALEFIARIRKDAKTRKHYIAAENFSMDPIDSLFVDNDFGWRVEFKLKSQQELCVEPETWND